MHRNPFVLAAAASPLFLSLYALFVGLTHNAHWLALVFHPAIFGLIFLFGAWARNPWARKSWPEVIATKSGVRLGNELIPRARIEDGFYVPRPGERGLVRLGLHGLRPSIDLSVRGEVTGRKLLRALGLDATQTTAKFRLMSRMHAPGNARYTFLAFALGGMMMALFARAMFGHAAATFIPIAILVATLGALVPTRVEVGVDGIMVSWFGRARFIPMKDVHRVGVSVTGFGKSRIHCVDIWLESGEVVKLPVGGKSWDDSRRAIVMERIVEALSASRGGGGGFDDAALLGRGGRSVHDWVADLRAIGSGANATHRVAPMDPARLWRVVEDPRAAATSRAAAAVALSDGLDDDGRLRLRELAKAVAAPKLRVALETTATAEAERRDGEASRLLEELAREEAEAQDQSSGILGR